MPEWFQLAGVANREDLDKAEEAVETAYLIEDNVAQLTSTSGKTYKTGVRGEGEERQAFCTCPDFVKRRSKNGDEIKPCKHIIWLQKNKEGIPRQVPVEKPAPREVSGLTIKRATPSETRIRIALYGPSGSGKTLTSLKFGTALGKVLLIDSEHGSASKYGGDLEFDTIQLTSFSPQDYGKALDAAAEAGYPVVIVDSLSHEWMGPGGILEFVDSVAQSKSTKTGSFGAWAQATPLHNKLINKILGYPGHVIATLRAKTQYEVAKGDDGKTKVTKLGLGPVQREGVDYEFDVFGSMEAQGTGVVLRIEKTRCPSLHGAVFPDPSDEPIVILKSWLGLD